MGQVVCNKIDKTEGKVMFMKKNLLSIALIFLFFTLSNAQVKSYREAVGLKGQVKTISVKEGGLIEIAGKYQEKCCQFAYSNTYDVTGNLIDARAGIPPVDYGPIPVQKKETNI
jgi:hypothetical protein